MVTAAPPPGLPPVILAVLSPKPSETISLPATVQFKVDNFSPQIAYLQVLVRPSDENKVDFEFPITQETKSVVIPDEPTITGRRNLTFQLAGPDHKVIQGSATTATINNLVLEGSKSSG